MQYFNTLPKIINTDEKGISLVMTNLMSRVSIIPEVLKNPMVYYQYDIQEGDTPETIAYKYYGDSYRYWIVLFANEITDPQWQWPMDNNVFSDYLLNKYGPTFNVYANVHHYEKVITKVDLNTRTTTVENVIIDESTYNSLPITTQTFDLPTGTVTIHTDKNAVNYYDYELNLNEKNRNIRILNANYVGELEAQFESLMA